MRSLISIAAAVLVATSLAGCDAATQVTDSGPDPDEAADSLATALVSGSFTDVAFTGDQTPTTVADDYTAVVAGLGELKPTVTAGGVVEDGDSATATLAWVWPIGDDEWSYTTDVELTKVDDEWQATWSRALVEPSLRKATVLDATSIGGARGLILGNRGAVLVTDREVTRFGVDRSKVPAASAAASAERLARLVGIDPAAYAKRVTAAGPKAFVEAITIRKEDVPVTVARRYSAIPGAVAIPDRVPLSPSRDFALPILGTVGDVTAEMVKEHPDRYEAGDQAGLSGLQARYDEQLQGVDGVVIHAVASDGMERELYRVDAQPGQTLELTLDESRQSAAEDALASVRSASALVAIRPSDGAILAAANGPGTDGYNIATYGQAAPGSTFKPVSALALLRAGLTPSTVVPCSRRIVVDGKPFENYDDYPSSGIGDIPLRTAFANSCNTAFIARAGKVSDGALADAAASLGIGIDHDLGFPAFLGSVPAPKSQTEAAADLIGQGAVLASPMSMATAVASIQSGRTVVPRLVTSVPVSVPAAAKPLTASEAAALRRMMRGVVTRGSGGGLLDVPGPPVIAKTGTAEFVRNGRKTTHAWMIAAQGNLAVAVYIEVGGSGAKVAGPVLEKFLRSAR